MKYVWLLWISDGERPWVEGVYVDKVKAEGDMRLLKGAEAYTHGYIYWIQEKVITA